MEDYAIMKLVIFVCEGRLSGICGAVHCRKKDELLPDTYKMNLLLCRKEDPQWMPLRNF